MQKLQNLPSVIVYPELDESRPSMVLLYIENCGTAPAKEIEVRFPDKFPLKAFGFSNPPKPGLLIEEPIKIPFLAPKSKIKTLWGQNGGLKAAGFENAKAVEIFFSSLEGERLSNKCDLSILQFCQLNADIVDSDGARQCAKQLESIAKVLKDNATKKDKFRIPENELEQKAQAFSEILERKER